MFTDKTVVRNALLGGKDLNTLGGPTTLMGERVVVVKHSHLAADRKDRSSSLPASLQLYDICQYFL